MNSFCKQFCKHCFFETFKSFSSFVPEINTWINTKNTWIHFFRHHVVLPYDYNALGNSFFQTKPIFDRWHVTFSMVLVLINTNDIIYYYYIFSVKRSKFTDPSLCKAKKKKKKTKIKNINLLP